MSTSVITADELASYIVCPTRYEFEHIRPISPRADHSDVSFERRRKLVADGLLAGLAVDGGSPSDQASVAIDRIVGQWPDTVGSYLNQPQQQFDSKLLAAAITTYFERFGTEHADGLVETNPVLASTFDGIRYETEVDALVKKGGTYRAIRFLPNLYGVHPSWKDEGLIEEYRSRSQFYPRQIGHLLRAWTALRGLLSTHGMDADVEFTYVSLFDDVRISYGADSDPTASVTLRNFQELFESERSEIRTLLRELGPKIIDGEFAVPDADRQLIADNCCTFCPFQDGCPTSIGSDVAFGNRPRAVGEDDA